MHVNCNQTQKSDILKSSWNSTKDLCSYFADQSELGRGLMFWNRWKGAQHKLMLGKERRSIREVSALRDPLRAGHRISNKQQKERQQHQQKDSVLV